MDKKNSLLVIHPGALGDVVLSFFSIARLAGCFSSVQLACQGEIGKIARRLGIVDRSFALESAFFAGLYGPPSTRLSAWLAEFDTILLFSVSGELQKLLREQVSADVVRVPPRPEPNIRIHVVDHLAAEIGRSGLFEGHRCDDARRAAAGFRDRRDENADVRKVLIHPGAGSRKKSWPMTRFFELAHRLKEGGFVPQFLLGPAETDLAPLIRRENKPLTVVEDAVSLLECLQKAGSLVGNDSGVSHLAAFIGLPTVAVFGPSDPVRWAPKGRAAVPVFAEGIDCLPCAEDTDHDCRHRRCLEAVTVKDVVEALERFSGDMIRC
ncbi:MAG: glycosyltransferase family 9 protein [Desulfobacterales bacterium]|nr:glycosyltransferase family 9 protein [Desulfobacterales bacterium]